MPGASPSTIRRSRAERAGSAATSATASKVRAPLEYAALSAPCNADVLSEASGCSTVAAAYVRPSVSRTAAPSARSGPLPASRYAR